MKVQFRGLLIGLLFTIFSVFSFAFSLGELRVVSMQGNGLVAEIPIQATENFKIQNASVSIAPRETYISTNTPYLPAYASLKVFFTENDEGDPIVRVIGQQGLPENLTLLIKINWNKDNPQSTETHEYSVSLNKVENAQFANQEDGEQDIVGVKENKKDELLVAKEESLNDEIKDNLNSSNAQNPSIETKSETVSQSDEAKNSTDTDGILDKMSGLFKPSDSETSNKRSGIDSVPKEEQVTEKLQKTADVSESRQLTPADATPKKSEEVTVVAESKKITPIQENLEQMNIVSLDWNTIQEEVAKSVMKMELHLGGGYNKNLKRSLPKFASHKRVKGSRAVAFKNKTNYNNQKEKADNLAQKEVNLLSNSDKNKDVLKLAKSEKIMNVSTNIDEEISTKQLNIRLANEQIVGLQKQVENLRNILRNKEEIIQNINNMRRGNGVMSDASQQNLSIVEDFLQNHSDLREYANLLSLIFVILFLGMFVVIGILIKNNKELKYASGYGRIDYDSQRISGDLDKTMNLIKDVRLD